MPAAAVIPAPIAYIKVAAVKKLVVGSREWAGGPQGEPPSVPDPASRRPPDAWPFLVGGAICLVHSDNERDSGLLNSYAAGL